MLKFLFTQYLVMSTLLKFIPEFKSCEIEAKSLVKICVKVYAGLVVLSQDCSRPELLC